jgi:hypothetical protein
MPGSLKKFNRFGKSLRENRDHIGSDSGRRCSAKAKSSMQMWIPQKLLNIARRVGAMSGDEVNLSHTSLLPSFARLSGLVAPA